MISFFKKIYLYFSCIFFTLLLIGFSAYYIIFYCKKYEKKNKELSTHTVQIKNLGVIMDGNRRWAKSVGKTYEESYIEGSKKFLELVELSLEEKLENIVVYALSLDNIKNRDTETEINVIYQVFKSFFYKESDWFLKRNVKVKFIGNIEELPELIQKIIKEIEDTTKDCTDLTVSLLFAYNFYEDIRNGYNNVCQKENLDTLKDLNKKEIVNYFQSGSIPDLDLVIRTGGDERLSGFLPIQSMYAELIFLPCFWPSIDIKDIKNLLHSVDSRQHTRNFGK